MSAQRTRGGLTSTWYRTSRDDGLGIYAQGGVVSETEHALRIREQFDGRVSVRTHQKRTNFACYHRTYEDARSFLINRERAKREELLRQLHAQDKRLQDAVDLPSSPPAATGET